jgi:hypothetical protein
VLAGPAALDHARMNLHEVLRRQDSVITRSVALEHMSQSALHRRLGSGWRILLPGVYLAESRHPTYRQRLTAAVLYGGDEAQLSDVTALRQFGLKYLPPDETVYLLIPAAERRASRDGVVVRRTHRLPEPCVQDGLPFTPLPRAIADFVARIGDHRDALAAAAEAVQRRLTAVADVVNELDHVTGRGTSAARHVRAALLSGVRSAPEGDFVSLCARSSVLPVPLLNPLLELPSGAKVCPDALFVEAGLVHETNGREPHAAEDRFEDMQARHGAMTAAGLVVLHSSPRQLKTEPARVLAQLEQCYLRANRSGLPHGVKLLRAAAA